VTHPKIISGLPAFFMNSLFPAFPDPDERESLETLQQNLINRSNGFYGANNYRIVLGLDGEVPVAACIADYLAESNCGAIEYILVSEDRRGEGLGRRIHDYTVGVLLGDANTAGKSGLDAIMVEINDPYQVSAESDNVDPFDRVMMWHKWGYQRLRFPYEQPALSVEQAAVTCLLLGVKVLNPALEKIFPRHAG
jgi:GNAT superfamily N-acetyltransferase